MDELPGFDAVEGKADDSAAYCKDRLPENEPQPRLKTINRKQLLLRPVDVERLVSDDHEVRAIWEFTGHLDLLHGVSARPALRTELDCGRVGDLIG